MAAWLIIATCWRLLLLVAAEKILHRSSLCQSRGDATCDNSGAFASKDQVLFQMASVKTIVEQKALNIETVSGSVRRRRRNADMIVCRRRHRSTGHADTDEPASQWKCNEQSNQMECSIGSGSADDDAIVGYPSTGNQKAAGLWCAVDIPPSHWNLKSCPATGNTRVRVLTYNLFWWNLFNRHQGSDRSAGRLIHRTGGEDKYDIMGFQECDDVWRVLHDASLNHAEYEAIDGGRAIAVAWRKSKWAILGHGSVDVGEDSRDQYYGKRSAVWVRLRSIAEGKIVFFVNHHGPLMVSQSGGCTGSATALNIMRVIGENARSNDVIILVGDFNAALTSSRVQEMERRLTRVHSGHIFGGVDHIFSNCGDRGTGQTLTGGDGFYKSDHQALNATFRI